MDQAMPGRSHGTSCLSSGRGNGMFFGGFGLNLLEEISRVVLGNCFPSQKFTCLGSCKVSVCSTDTHYVGTGLLRNTCGMRQVQKLHQPLRFLHHLAQMLQLCPGGCLECKTGSAVRNLMQQNELSLRLRPKGPGMLESALTRITLCSLCASWRLAELLLGNLLCNFCS